MPLYILALLFQHALCYINATGVLHGRDPATGHWPVRQEIRTLANGEEMWDLYIQALIAFQSAPPEDPLSYYQIAGIHGYPTGPWDGVGGNGMGGFCMHKSVLFPIWHRPYLALYEQILSQHAYEIALQYPVENRSVYLNAAKLLRIPYWDWALDVGLPRVMTQLSIRVNTPSGAQTVTNPLYQYNFPFDMRGLFPSNDESTMLLVNLTHTVEHYDPRSGLSDFDGVSAELAARSPKTLHDLYRLFVDDGSNVTWTSFAKYVNDTSKCVEGIHGTIHNALGGIDRTQNPNVANGHMAVIQFSAFDPSFWLHHANVDRVTAIWQVLHEDKYVVPDLNADGTFYLESGSTDTEQTPLAPFHSGTGDAMWTATTARNISTFGYTYPELVETGRNGSSFKAIVLEKINRLYNPNLVSPSNSSRHILKTRNTNIAQVMSNVHADTALRLGVNNLEVQWYLRIRADSQSLNELAIFFFVGEEPVDRTSWLEARNLVGSYAPLFGYGPVSNVPTAYVDIPCTHTIAAAVDRGLLHNILPEATVPFIASHIRARITGPVSNATRESLQINIVSQRLRPRTTFTEVPLYQDSEDHGELDNIEFVAS